MSLIKNLFIWILNFLLILFLSISVISLSFATTINERTLNATVNENIEPFVGAKVDQSFTDYTAEKTEAAHKYALEVCKTNNVYEIASQDENKIYMNCDEVRSATPEQFLVKMKGTIKDYVMNFISESLEESTKPLKYVTPAIWISIIISFVLVIAIILISWGFPFRTFGMVGIIVGSPFIALLISKPFILEKVQHQIQNSIPPEILTPLSQSTVLDGITSLISTFLLVMVAGFAILFSIGLILFSISLLVKKKNLQVQQP
ncbi:hypothetical protein J4233_04080 [Candidatus Pacearchaeota archaeon]|nr:hypothetical protein [Candidatus Pacearchaeota archaeon]